MSTEREELIDDMVNVVVTDDGMIEFADDETDRACAGRLADHLIALGFRKQEPVSDLTEAEVEAAFKSWNGWHVGTVRDRLRAALVAARAVTNGDKQ